MTPIPVGARDSPLSRVQVEEVFTALHRIHPDWAFDCHWVKTWGDRDMTQSLRNLSKKSDFFTRELDQMILQEKIRVAIHSAKDLPEPLPQGVECVALTRGIDPRDSLVLREGETLASLPPQAVIATSSARREAAIRSLRSDLRWIDLRGTIGERLSLLHQRKADGVVVAEAALLRLQLTHLNRMILPGETAKYQGRLAICIKRGDREMQQLFAALNDVPRVLYLGMDPTRWQGQGRIVHFPVIRTERLDSPQLQEALGLWSHFTHVIFTSRSAVRHWWEVHSQFAKIAIAIGEGTAEALRQRGVEPLIVPEASQEGIIQWLQRDAWEQAYFFLPCSKRARPDLWQCLQRRKCRAFRLFLYDTILQHIEPTPSLAEIDEIVFTSPSTVEGFLQIYGVLPQDKKRIAIGNITNRLLCGQEKQKEVEK